MLNIKQFIFNPFGESTYVVWDNDLRQAIVVDPGMCDDSERRRLDSYLSDNNLELTGIVNTHMHLDHCIGANYVKNRYGVKVHASAADAPLGAMVPQQAMRFGMDSRGYEPVTVDVPLADGDTIDVGSEKLEVIAVPGHSPGGIALYSATGRFVLTGDSLFCGSVGRTDLPGGDYGTLINSVSGRLLSLPDDTLVLPGHGDSTTIGRERESNPFL